MAGVAPIVLAESLQGKKIGLLGCTEKMQVDFSAALRLAEAMSGTIEAGMAYPGSRELERYDALVLHIGGQYTDGAWHRPEVLRTNTRPLLLAGDLEAIHRRSGLQRHADDVILPPFSPAELIFRLSRLVAPNGDRRPVLEPTRPCVLVVDDDPAIVNFMKAWLQNFDVDAHFVGDGRAAVYAARQLLPDLLLLDLDMPIMDGLAALRTLRQDAGTSGVVTVLLTASSDSSDVKSGFELGAVDYIVKPFSHFDLTRKLRNLLRMNERAPARYRRGAHPETPVENVNTGSPVHNRWAALFGENHHRQKRESESLVNAANIPDDEV